MVSERIIGFKNCSGNKRSKPKFPKKENLDRRRRMPRTHERLPRKRRGNSKRR